MASRKRIVICYILLQASFWGMLSSICAYQAAVVLDRGFTAGQAGIFCALCYFASLFTQPVIGGWADRHPEVPLKRLLIVMLLPAIALNLVFYFTRPNFLLTALTFFLFGVLETNSYPLIDSMGMQYVNAGVQIPYSLSRGIGSLSYALLCVATGLLTARFGMQAALLAHCAEQLVMLVCLLLFPSIPAQLLPQPQKGAASGHSALQILRGSRSFTLMLIACFFGMMGVMPISGFLVTLVTSRGGDSRALGLAQFLMAASELPSALVFGLLRRRLSSAKILLISIVFMAVKPLLILASGSLGMLLAVQPVQMLGYGLFFPASVYFANESVAPADRVQGQSLRTIVAISLSTLLGSLVSGYLLDLGGTTLMLWFSSARPWASPRSPCRKNMRRRNAMSDVLVFVLELIGTVAFAVSGAIVGIKKQMDLFGVIVLGICTAVGGGIVRDLILGVTPPVTFQNPVYTLTAAAVSVLMFLPHMRARIGRHEPVFDRLLLVMDAVGLGVFTVVGVQCAYQQSEDYTLFLLIFVGLITGVGGGVLRDVFSGERPYIFVRHFYACASIVGALICALCWRALGGNAAMLFGAAVVVVLRLLAAYYHWNLPRSDYHESGEEASTH